METYQVKNLGFTYPNAEESVLKEISLKVNKGEFLLIGGPTGSGKTTLLRLLKQQTQPVGELTGCIRFEGVSLHDLGEKESAEQIGMVFQQPDNQIVMSTVWQQLCYGMENLGYHPTMMQKRMAEVVPFFGMESWLHQSVETLSGGQKQLLNLAAVMMLQPKVLLLDEPTAQLDPVTANAFIDLLARINQEMSVTVILCEHRLESLYPMANRLLLMKNGSVAYQGKPDEISLKIWHDQDPDFSLYLSNISKLYLKMGKNTSPSVALPMTVKDGKRWFDGFYNSHAKLFKGKHHQITKTNKFENNQVMECSNLYFQYGKMKEPVLKRISFKIYPEEYFVLFGGNGAGKSTLLKLMAGIHLPQRGTMHHHQSKPVGYVAQNPMAYFTKDTVGDQLRQRADDLNIKHSNYFTELIHEFNLEPIMDKHPFDISGGQQQQLVLALVLMADPDLILLDEPTKGLDPARKQTLGKWLKNLQLKGKTIFMVSHDIEFAAAHATRCGMLFDGEIIAMDHPTEFFTNNYYYTTMVHRAVREYLPEEFTEEGVMARWNDTIFP